LKLLRRIEVDVLQRIDQMLLLHPELSEGDVDQLLLEDLSRLAYRHQRLTELFQGFRKRIGIEDAPATDEDSQQ
jgi:uncharacterized protein (DUF58 family)